jgi:Ca2+:H+ antiporter
VRRFLLSSEGWPYLLVPAIPIAIALELAHASASVLFLVSALGVIPTAALMGRARSSRPARAPASVAC